MSDERVARRSPRRGRTATLGVCLGLAVLVLVPYAQVAGHGFVNYDDPGYVYENPFVQRGLTWDGVEWACTGVHKANWHPLTWLSHMADCELFGQRPGAHHLVNVALHAANTVLLFLVLRLMTGKLWPCAFAGALFAVHPLHVESVAWISERKDVLAGLFWMLALLAYARYARRPGPWSYFQVCAALALGLTAKPTLVTVPFVLLLLDLWPLGRWRLAAERPRLLLEKLPLLALAFTSSVITVLAQQHSGAVRTFEAVPLDLRLANAAVSYVAYLWSTVWPVGLNFFYPHPALASTSPVSGLIVPAAAAAALLAAVTLLVLRGAARRPYLAVGWLWYLGTLIPVIGLVQVGMQARADRYVYLPLIGIYLIAAWGARDLAARWPRAIAILSATAASLVAACVAATWIQVGYWRDSRTLAERAIRVNPNNYVAHHNLGVALEAEREFARARSEFETALAIRPQYPLAQFSLGVSLWRAGKLSEAADHFERALRLNPDYAEAHINLGVVLQEQGDLSRAAGEFERALQINPGHAQARNGLGVVSVKRGDLARAIEQFEEAIRFKPDYAEAHYNLGVVKRLQGDLARADGHLRRVLEIDPDHAGAHYNLGVVLARQQKLTEALSQLERALQLRPGYREAAVALERVRKALRQGANGVY